MCIRKKIQDSQTMQSLVDVGIITCDDIINCFWKEKPYIIKVGEKLIKLPHLIAQEVFWCKFEKFILEVKSDPAFEVKFASTIANSEDKDDFAKRIIVILDKIEEEQKVEYIINATRALCWNQINRIEYFRICRAIERTYIEDLLFVKKNFNSENLFSEDITVEELTAVGIMRQSVIDAGSLDYSYVPKTHSFTAFGKLVYDAALNYEKAE